MAFVNYCLILILILIFKYCKTSVYTGETLFHQDDYDIEHDRLELIHYNKSAVKDPLFAVFKYNETLRMKALNLSAYFLPGVKKNIYCRIGVFKYVKNKYRPFPINLTIELCDEYKKLGNKNPFGMQDALRLSNFRGCPCQKGLYYIYNWVLAQEKFPPHIPGGKFKLTIYVYIDDSIYLLSGAWFGEIIPKKR